MSLHVLAEYYKYLLPLLKSLSLTIILMLLFFLAFLAFTPSQITKILKNCGSALRGSIFSTMIPPELRGFFGSTHRSSPRFGGEQNRKTPRFPVPPIYSQQKKGTNPYDWNPCRSRGHHLTLYTSNYFNHGRVLHQQQGFVTFC